MDMKNGWMRLWTLGVVCWLCFITFVVIFDGLGWDAFLFILTFSVLPPIATLALGYGIAWVIQGFRNDK